MRPIKFRAWHKENKEMWTAEDLIDNEYNLYADGRIEYHLLSYENNKCIKTDDFILMQFTGLHDKNGKEIFEGDILSWEAGSDEYDRGHVYYYRGGFFISFEKTPHHSTSEPVADELENYKIEVLGNIYENPELLK